MLNCGSKMLFRILATCALATAVVAGDGYQIPEPKFKLLKPRGFRVSIPDESGLQLFAFHGNLNKDMEHLSGGQMSGDVVTKENGRWVYENKKLKLRKGDVINYWVFVIKNGIGYRLDGGVYTCRDVKFMGKRSQYLQRRKRHVSYIYNPIGHHRYSFHIPHGHGYHYPAPEFPSPYTDSYWPYPGAPEFPINRHFHHDHHNHDHYNHNHHNHHHHNCHNMDSDDEDNSGGSSEETTTIVNEPGPVTNEPRTNVNEPRPTVNEPTPTTTTTTETPTTDAPTTTEIPTTVTSTVPSIDIRFKED